MPFLNDLNICLFGDAQNVLNIQFYDFCKYCICLYIITITPIFRTKGDGNCLYNACSVALCGTENLAPYSTCVVLHASSFLSIAYFMLNTLSYSSSITKEHFLPLEMLLQCVYLI